MKKKITQLRWLAAMIMLVAAMVMPSTAWAEDYDENGFGSDESNPYQPAKQVSETYHSELNGTHSGYYAIENAGQLYWFAGLVNGTLSGVDKNLSANAVLTTDITVNENVLKDDGTPADETSNFRNWTPIGSTFDGGYTGKFDGKGHTISGLYLINNPTDYTYVGLFGVTRVGAVITNLGVVDSYFAGKSYVGGVCARQNAGTISNCYNAGSVRGLASNSEAGGVCGNSDVLKHCYNRGKVWGSGHVGSLIGKNNSNGIENCYYLEGTAEKGVGSSPNVDVSSCVVGKSAEQFKRGEVTYLLNQSTSSGNLAWYQNIEGDAKDDFPVLDSNHGTVYQVTGKDNQITYSNQAPCQHEEYNNGICTSCGTFEEPAKSDEIYKIANYGNLLWFANEVNRGSTAINAELICDITANDNLIAANGSVTEAPEYIWTPIGNATNNYTGKFDGKGHTISGLYVKSTTDKYVGLFGFVRNAEISNVGVEDSYFDGAVYAGGICGRGVSITITNCYSTGEVRSSGSESYVGGICGYILGIPGSPVTITNCYNIGEVSGSGDYVGGVCGSSSSNCVISNCYYLVGMPAGSNTAAQTDMFKCSISQFASGEVCYLLNGSRSEGTEENPLAWYQNISSDSRDTYPVLTGTGTNTVYQVKILCGGTVDAGNAYSNTNKDITVEHILPESPVFNSDKKIYSKICQREGCGKAFYYSDAAGTIEATLNAEETAFAVASYTLTDATVYNSEAEFTATSLAYKRTFYDDKWMAVYVPFAIDCSQLVSDYEMATINNFHEYEQEDGTYNVVLEVKRVTKGGTIPALTPCLIRMKTDSAAEVEKTLTFANAEFSAAADKSIDCSSVTRYYQFFGTLNGKTGLTAGTDFVLNAGKLYNTSESTVLLPQRWYLSATDRTSTPVEPVTMLRSISINVIGDGEATGIEDIQVNTELGAAALSGTGIYDLQGRKINSEPTKGMYIKNGKKYIK